MNLLECTVVEVISKPYFKFDKWWVNMNYECYGLNSAMIIMFDTEKECEKVKIGYVFLS